VKLRNLIAAALLFSAFSPFAGAEDMNTRIYGYINGYWEDVDDQPTLTNTGADATSKNPSEFQVPNVHLIVQSKMDQFKTYLNVYGTESDALVVNNAWVESDLHGDYLKFRIGKLYRPFGLYNEILDAVPTYIGIEPPELFDGDHLMLTRTTNAMLHGRAEMGPGFLNYALTTGNDERESSQTPYGMDVNYTIDTRWKIGSSYYNSGGYAKSLASIGTSGKSGSFGAVLPWMSEDKFSVFGGYLQYRDDHWTFQVATYAASHDATRDSAAVTSICSNAKMSTASRARFGCGGTINTNGDYDVKTSYTRLGYTFITERGNLTPYAQFDMYENKETVLDKSWGGDNEAGLADDGKFSKATLGLFYQPTYAVALKSDYSQHLQKVNGRDQNYGEVRFSFSYFWRLQ